MKIRFGIRIPPSGNPRNIAEFCKTLEETGWNYAWFPESQLMWRDLFVTMALCALNTSRITLGTNVTNPVTRHPSVIAGAVATLDEIAEGRVVLGIGSGYRSVETVGLRSAKIGLLRESIRVIKGLLRGDLVEFGATRSRMMFARRPIPVYLGAMSPRMIQLAGEICDGVIAPVGITEQAVRYVRDNVRAGALRSGREADTIDYVCSTYCLFTEDIDKGINLAKPLLLQFIEHHAEALRVNNLPIPQLKQIGEVQQELRRGVDLDSAMRGAAEQLDRGVLERFAEKFCMIGKAEDALQKIEKLRRLGVTNFYITSLNSHDIPFREANVFTDEILPHLS